MSASASRAGTILIADDNPANVDILRTRLSGHGYEIITANDGEAALEASRQHLPDLILLDVMMPKRDGLEVCRLLKSDPALPFMPIILCTAKAVQCGHKLGSERIAQRQLGAQAVSCPAERPRQRSRHVDRQMR